MGDRKKQTFAESARSNWNGFLKFLYDSEQGTVLGRAGGSWSELLIDIYNWNFIMLFSHSCFISAKILIFYLFYYGALAGLFSLSLMIVQNTLDDYTPTYQTRLQTPGKYK